MSTRAALTARRDRLGMAVLTEKMESRRQKVESGERRTDESTDVILRKESVFELPPLS